MRVVIDCKSKSVIKKASGSQYLFHCIQTLLNDYTQWLSGVGFVAPETTVSYDADMITFTQIRVTGGKTRNIDEIVTMLQKLNFSTYGLDASPNNFLGQDSIYFVDFFPFLVRDERIVAEQFNYNITDVYQRYFTISNILLCLINRMFKLNPGKARYALVFTKNVLLDGYDQLLPRDKLRLLRALEVDRSETIISFPPFYTSSKDINLISPEDDVALRGLLERIA